MEWNSNAEIANAAEKLYGHIDRLELYVGLQAEEAKPVIPGAGLCPCACHHRPHPPREQPSLTAFAAYTISRAILSDAIALTRGDRFFTTDYTPFNLTAWGFADAQRDPDGPGNGSMLGRLLLRTLPQEYSSASTYTWFPLMTPTFMDKVLADLGWTETYERKRPTTMAEPLVVASYEDVKTVLKDDAGFGTGFPERVRAVVQGDG